MKPTKRIAAISTVGFRVRQLLEDRGGHVEILINGPGGDSISRIRHSLYRPCILSQIPIRFQSQFGKTWCRGK